MKNLITILLLMFAGNALAVDAQLGLYGASTTTDCTSSYCGIDDETNTMMTVGVASDYFGGEALFTNNAGGFAGYYHKKLGGLALQFGLMLIPDVAYGNAAGFPEVKQSSTEFAPFIGIKYKALALRYTQYSADHNFSSSMQVGTDTITGAPIIATGTASVDADKSVLWAGLVFNF